jgi:hypothetical protein
VSLVLPNPSSRLVRAAAAERSGLARHREHLAGKRDRLAAELRDVTEALRAVDERLVILAQLVDGTGSDEPAEQPAVPDIDPDRRVTVLRGPAIREVAVRVLLAQPQHIEALHYRRWYGLLEDAGYAVAGKDPVAVFLTQVSRSPVVRKATEPGMYEVDRQAPLRIRQRHERLQAELRELAAAPQSPVDLGTVRARRHELDMSISQQERALDEALRVLQPAESGTASAGAVGAV